MHAGTGQVHVRPFLDLNRSEDAMKLPAIADEVHSLALDLGGTVSAQEGTGLARTPWVARQYGPLYPVLRELKAIFDPHQLFNPGKIISADAALKPEWSLRLRSVTRLPCLRRRICRQATARPRKRGRSRLRCFVGMLRSFGRK